MLYMKTLTHLLIVISCVLCFTNASAQKTIRSKRILISAADTLLSRPFIKTRQDGSTAIYYSLKNGENWLPGPDHFKNASVMDSSGNILLGLDGCSQLWDIDSLIISKRVIPNKKVTKYPTLSPEVCDVEYTVYSGYNYSILYSFKVVELHGQRMVTYENKKISQAYHQDQESNYIMREIRKDTINLVFGNSQFYFCSSGAFLTSERTKPHSQQSTSSLQLREANILQHKNLHKINQKTRIEQNNIANAKRRVIDSVRNSNKDASDLSEKYPISSDVLIIEKASEQGFINQSKKIVLSIDCEKSTCSPQNNVYFVNGVVAVKYGAKNRLLFKSGTRKESEYVFDCIGNNINGNLCGAYRLGGYVDTFFTFTNNRLYLIPAAAKKDKNKTIEYGAFHLPLSIPKLFAARTTYDHKKDEEVVDYGTMDSKGFFSSLNLLYGIKNAIVEEPENRSHMDRYFDFSNFTRINNWYYIVTGEKNGKPVWFAINDSLRMVTPYLNEQLITYNDGIAVVKINENNNDTYRAKNIKTGVYFPDSLKTPALFSEGYLVRDNSSDSYLNDTYKRINDVCYLDKKGNKCFTNLSFSNAGAFSNGLAVVQLQGDSLYNYLRPNGTLVFKKGFKGLAIFRGWPALIALESDRYNNYINEDGSLFYKPEEVNTIQSFGQFGEGLAYVRYKSSWIIQNSQTRKQTVIPPSIKNLGYFINEDKLFFAKEITPTGNRVSLVDRNLKPKFPLPSSFDKLTKSSQSIFRMDDYFANELNIISISDSHFIYQKIADNSESIADQGEFNQRASRVNKITIPGNNLLNSWNYDYYFYTISIENY